MTVTFEASSNLPTRFGHFRLHVFKDENGTERAVATGGTPGAERAGKIIEHLALATGTPRNGCLVRLHSECATGDILGSMRCDCRDQLESSLRRIDEEGEGLLIYIRDHEGRGIGLANKIRAYALQDDGMDTVDANIHLGFAPDQRNYAAAIGMLRHFGLSEIKLLTNNRLKIDALESAGIKVARQVPLWTATNPYNEDYLQTKRTKMGHI